MLWNVPAMLCWSCTNKDSGSALHDKLMVPLQLVVQVKLLRLTPSFAGFSADFFHVLQDADGVFVHTLMQTLNRNTLGGD